MSIRFLLGVRRGSAVVRYASS